jgi:D-glycero-D-manno-heptose 1,7-bisphosphate phosphatase
MVNPCIFLDRDGVIVVPEFRDGRSFAPKHLQDFAYFPETDIALKRLKAAGYLLIVVTNQPDVGNGLVQQEVIENMHSKMQAELPIDHIEVCYHTQTNDCQCRKPQPGMLLNVLQKFEIDLEHSFMIGDRSSDIEVGKKLNLKTIFIDYHYQEPITQIPDFTCFNLSQCADIILNSKNN